MKTITFRIMVSGLDAGDRSDADEEENIADCILDALGYPEGLTVTAKVLHRRGAAQNTAGWNSIETIPRDRKVLVRTVTGMERVAKVVHGAGILRGRVHCWRRDKGKTGDLQAVAWKEFNE